MDKLSKFLQSVGGKGLLVLAPFLLARVVLAFTQSALPTELHAVVLLAFFLILIFGAWLISGETVNRFLPALYKQGIKWPFLFSISLLLFAIPCFASLTSTLNDHHLISFDPAIAPKEFSGVQDFYTWHFLDSIPALKVPETLAWPKPYKYSDRLSGLLLLAFKLIVIIPVIGSFTAWNRIRKEAKRES